MKVNITIDDIRQRPNLTTIKDIRFTKMSFFFAILGFTQSHLGTLSDIVGFVQLIPDLYKSERPKNITGFGKIHFKTDCIDGSNLDGVRQPILFSFGLSSPRSHKIFKEHRIKLLKEINKFVLSHITISLNDDDHKPVNFHGETVNLTCQQSKIK